MKSTRVWVGMLTVLLIVGVSTLPEYSAARIYHKARRGSNLPRRVKNP